MRSTTFKGDAATAMSELLAALGERWWTELVFGVRGGLNPRSQAYQFREGPANETLPFDRIDRALHRLGWLADLEFALGHGRETKVEMPSQRLADIEVALKELRDWPMFEIRETDVPRASTMADPDSSEGKFLVLRQVLELRRRLERPIALCMGYPGANVATVPEGASTEAEFFSRLGNVLAGIDLVLAEVLRVYFGDWLGLSRAS